MRQRLFIVILFISFIGMGSCKKFLDEKSNQSLATPETLADLEAVLNNSAINRGTYLVNGMTDEYYFLFSNWNSRPKVEKDAYIWHPETNDYNDWSVQYHAVFNANTVLFNLELITDGNISTPQEKRIRGGALFYRAFTFYRIAQLYALQYDANTASALPGIPLRLTADINEVSTRPNLQDTYNQITTDLQEALQDLDETKPENIVSKTYPTRTAAYALLARVYLQMGDYTKAKNNADQALQFYSDLMNFYDNSHVDTISISPFKPGNREIILYAFAQSTPNSNAAAKIDTTLYKSYADNDLRKRTYFNRNSDGSYRFKGSYSGNFTELFCGLATDELYLIKAECLARGGDAAGAMQTLNDLLRTRWRVVNGTSTYVDQTAVDANDALAKVIKERKKELVYREIRWPDIKRLNKEPAFAITLTRNLNGQIYMLPPNDLRFALLIPIEVMNIANLPQNPR